jgi:hypothetical protein
MQAKRLPVPAALAVSTFLHNYLKLGAKSVLVLS